MASQIVPTAIATAVFVGIGGMSYLLFSEKRKFKIAAWTIIGVAALFLVSRSKPTDSRADAEAAAKGYFAAQVIRCYQMSDAEMMAHEALCRDALRRIQN